MNKVSLRSLTFMLLIAFLVWSSTFEACNARRGKHWRQRTASASLYNKKGKTYGSSKHNHNGGSSKPKAPPEKVPLPPPVPTPTDDTPSRTTPAGKGYSSGHSSTFNVIDFGAKGDGITDDTKAFQAAWIAACKVEASMITVPADAIFLVGPISFSGPYCQANLVFQLDGTIIAPTDYKTWSKGLLQWLEFTKLRGITIQGTGIIDGRGSSWWEDSPLDDPIDDESKLIVPINNTKKENPKMPIRSELGGKMPGIKPTALRFYGSFNVTVKGITIQNSPLCHLKFDYCMGVLVHDIAISSPGDSPNTDGIHLQNSSEVLIHSTSFSCGNYIACRFIFLDCATLHHFEHHYYPFPHKSHYVEPRCDPDGSHHLTNR